MTRVRFLSTYETATSFYRDVLPHLATYGSKVEAVFSSAAYRQGRSPLREALRDSGVRITYIPTGLTRADSRARKCWAMLTFVVGASLRTLLGRGADVNVFFSTPPFFALWGTILSLVRRQRYVCVVMDVYPHVLIQLGTLKRGSWSVHLLGRLMRLAWRRASHVVVIGRCMRDVMISQGVESERVEVIQNWAYTTIREPLPRDGSTLREEWGLTDKFVVLYSGNMGVSHTFDDIIAAAKALRPREDIAFVFVGDGPRRVELAEAKERLRLDNLQLRPFQPADRLAESLSVADVHFLCLREGFEGLVVPSKAYGCMASGRPLLYLGRAEGEIARAVREYCMGQVVSPGRVEQLKRLLVEYADDPERVRLEGYNALRAHHEVYGPDRALGRYRTLLA